jgi:hypothetical protein
MDCGERSSKCAIVATYSLQALLLEGQNSKRLGSSTNEVGCDPRTPTQTLEPSLKTRQSNEHQPDVHKAEIGDDGEEVQDQLLGYVEVFQVYTIAACKHKFRSLVRRADVRRYARLGVAADGEEEGIDGGEIAESVENDEG